MECKRSGDLEDPDEELISRKTKSQEDIVKILENSSIDDKEIETDKLENSGKFSRTSSLRSGYRLLWQRSFACPIMGLARLDIVRDGMDDLVVITLSGVHIIQVRNRLLL